MIREQHKNPYFHELRGDVLMKANRPAEAAKAYATAVSLDPGLRRTLRAGVEAGALAGLVSGSGPTCAFLCSSEEAALDVSSRLAGAGVCRTVRVASGPVPGARVIPATDAS